jgi:hypothetical protein
MDDPSGTFYILFFNDIALIHFLTFTKTKRKLFSRFLSDHFFQTNCYGRHFVISPIEIFLNHNKITFFFNYYLNLVHIVVKRSSVLAFFEVSGLSSLVALVIQFLIELINSSFLLVSLINFYFCYLFAFLLSYSSFYSFNSWAFIIYLYSSTNSCFFFFSFSM